VRYARFIPLPENRSALLAVQQVAACVCARRGKLGFNPLFLHGPSGSGKTHLVSFLIHEITRRSPRAVIAVLPAGEIPGAVDESAAGNGDALHNARQSDLVLVEDLQLLATRVERILGQLLDELLARQVQIVFTAVTGPKGLKLPMHLTSRLASGLVVGLEPLQTASRLVFLEEKAKQAQFAVRRDILAWLADRLTGGCRQLEGAMTRLQTLARMCRDCLDVPAIERHFQEEISAARPTVERIVQRVGGHYNVEPRQLRSDRRSRNIVLPRQVGMYLARQLTGLSLEQIGAYFGGRDHSTVLHACRKVEEAIESDAVLSGTIHELQADLA
jgi:chromosomal replication initiator protein